MAQVPPSAIELARYTGLHAAAARGDAVEIRRLLSQGLAADLRDGHGRTPLQVAAFQSRYEGVRALVQGGADPNAIDAQRYDIATIAAVKDDVAMVKLALALGTRSGNVTSPYDGTALIAAAHLGHEGVVRELIAARAPLDHGAWRRRPTACGHRAGPRGGGGQDRPGRPPGGHTTHLGATARVRAHDRPSRAGGRPLTARTYRTPGGDSREDQ